MEVEHEDARSVDDLLSFINGGDRDSKGVRTSKNKRKNRRRKYLQKNIPSNCASSSNEISSLNNAIRSIIRFQMGLMPHAIVLRVMVIFCPLFLRQ